MGFFDFIGDLPFYDGKKHVVERMNRRHDFLIADFAADIVGARVLDLAAHDGRWSYAFAGAGAQTVVGIEARAELVARFADYPDQLLRDRVDLRVGDIFEGLDNAVAVGEAYDVVAVFGIFYHIMDHFRLLQLIGMLRPKLVILDSEFILRTHAVISLIRERTDNPLNAMAQFPGQSFAVKGVPSMKALELMADASGFDLAWSDWSKLDPEDRIGVPDYFRPEARKKRRATCALRPCID